MTVSTLFLLLLLVSISAGLIKVEPTAVVMSSTYSSSHSGSHCIDGDLNTFCHTRGGESHPWLAVNIGHENSVHKVKINNRQNCCGERTKNMKVFVTSRLPKTANSWFTGGHLLGSFTGPSVTAGKVELDTDAEMTGTLVIIQMATNYINLAEIEVFVGSSHGAAPSSCSYPAGHTMTIYTGPSRKCLSESISSGLDQASRNAIVRVHNELRNKVALGKETSGSQPSAADMRKMVWDDEVAKIAQRWADQCHFGHDRERNLCDGTYAGQNAYISSSSAELSPYSALSDCENAVTAWYNEVKKPGFNHGHISPFRFDHGTGHYTQVVWAQTDRLGCGLRYYKEGGWFQTLIICNYAIGGNMIGARMYKEGAPCSECPPGRTCDTTYRGLCV